MDRLLMYNLGVDMDKRTLLAVVLSVIIITVGFTIQSVFFMPEPSATEIVSQPAANSSTQTTTTDTPQTASLNTPSSLVYESGVPGSVQPLGQDPEDKQIIIENAVFRAIFTSKGGALVSMEMKKHLDDGIPVDMIFNSRDDQAAFYLYFGGDTENPVDCTFDYTRIDDYTVEFYRDFAIVGEDGEVSDESFTVRKTFVFSEQDYLFEVYVSFENSVNQIIPLNYDGFAYTIAYEPQIGPEFYEELDGRYTFRKFYTYEDGKKNLIKLKNGEYVTNDFISWASLTGKYFTVIGVPDATSYRVSLRENAVEGIPQGSQMYFSRPVIRSSANTDVFRFYMGPILKQDLSIYNKASDNGFGLSDLQLDKAVDSSSWLGWLETVLKWLLAFFYSIIPNYGVAIILLTILIKVVLYPITKKTFSSTAKMAALAPQIEELKEKYKDNPNKLNAETAELYKREKVNPMGGCLPMLLQFPIFIALYGLLNKHFELRGAVFIPGWITDLSLPESIFSFAPISIPFVGSDIRLLPILYVGSMIFSMKQSQSATAGTAQTQSMNKMMIYFMPIMFFFILYNAPSGLILYWSVMNLFTIIQQKVTTSMKVHEIEEEKAHPELKIVKKESSTAGNGKKKGKSSKIAPKRSKK